MMLQKSLFVNYYTIYSMLFPIYFSAIIVAYELLLYNIKAMRRQK
jgi:hypothetical protein